MTPWEDDNMRKFGDFSQKSPPAAIMHWQQVEKKKRTRKQKTQHEHSGS
jgi:hypothetical protein